jgi:hypothetical protein
MAYNPNIPQATDELADSQSDILADFQEIETWVSVNHYDFASPNEGKHKFVTMPEQTASPGTALDEMALYTKAVAGITQLFLQRENIAPTGADINLTSFSAVLANGGTNLPSGVILKWGQGATVAGVQTVTFTTAFPTALLSVQVSPAVSAGPATYIGGINVSSYSATAFSVVNQTGGAQNYCWFAIGY